MTNKSKKLTRSVNNKILGGVAAGIASYFDIDPVIIRISFIALSVANGFGVLIYILMWLLVPTKTSSGSDPKQNAREMRDTAQNIINKLENSKSSQPNRTFGLILITLGIFFFLNNFGIISWSHISKFWPLIIILFGITVLFKRD